MSAFRMSRRKQTRPRHVDNDGAPVESELRGPGSRDLGLDNRDKNVVDEGMEYLVSSCGKRSSSGDENSDDEMNNGVTENEDVSTSSEASSPTGGADRADICDKCGVGFNDQSEFTAHQKFCGDHSRIVMAYDPPPINGYFHNGYSYDGRSSGDSVDKGFSDEEDRRCESTDEDSGSRQEDSDFVNDEVCRKRKRRDIDDNCDDDDDDDDDMSKGDKANYISRTASGENCVLGLGNRLFSSGQTVPDRPQDGDTDLTAREKVYKNHAQKVVKTCSQDHGVSNPSSPVERGGDSIAWAMKAAERRLFGDINKAAERRLFGDINNITLPPLACTLDRLGSRGSIPDEVNIFHAMLFQLQQQQMMQVHILEQMKQQLVASGLNPGMSCSDGDIKTSQNRASDGISVSEFQNASVAPVTGKRDCSGSHDNALRSSPGSESDQTFLQFKSTFSGVSRYEPPTAGTDAPDTSDAPLQENAPLQDHAALQENAPLQDVGRECKEGIGSRTKHVEKYINLDNHELDPPLTKNLQKIPQERTASCLPSIPSPVGLWSSISSSTKSSTRSSLLSSSALFASSPSLSALQKETDALKPSPMMPTLNLPMTPEDYRGYIQRGTILERSQYASDDPFFKHKCRFCHKVFGSDSALQIHVRSHTGERPFKCNICGNRFSTKGNLKVHFERHKAKYPHVKMDATPVPEHLDRQPHLFPSFSPATITPSAHLNPTMARTPVSPVPRGQPSSPAVAAAQPPRPSPVAPGFGRSFIPGLGPGLSLFGVMPPPPREPIKSFSCHPALPLTYSLPLALPVEGNISTDTERKSTDPPVCDVGHSRYRCEDSSGKVTNEIPSEKIRYLHSHHHIETDERHVVDIIGSQESGGKRDKMEEEEEEGGGRVQGGQSQTEPGKKRSISPQASRSSEIKTAHSDLLSQSLLRPSSCQNPFQSAGSVMSWTCPPSPQDFILPGGYPPLFLHGPALPRLPDLGFLLSSTPSFPLGSPLTPVLPIPPSFFPATNPAQISPLPGEGFTSGSSGLPAKVIDPSENLEQYMEVHKSETSKLEALVKNIEQKITDPNQCVVCQRVLSCKSALQMHYRIHTGERPFRCKICGRSFTTKGNLKTHMGVHRAKPAVRMMHQCPVCHKEFTNFLVLQQHVSGHTGSVAHLAHLQPHLNWAQRSSIRLSSALHQVRHLPHPRIPSTARLARTESLRELRSLQNEFDYLKAEYESKRSDQVTSEQCDISGSKCGKKENFEERVDSRSVHERPQPSHLRLTIPEFQTAVSSEALSNTPSDAPLAALEEKVRAIESKVSQKSFEKFRRSMGLNSPSFPNKSMLSGRDNSMESPSKSMLSGGDNSMESPSKSMLSGGDNSMESPSKSMLSGGDNSMESPSKSMLSGGDNSMESPSKSMLSGGDNSMESPSKSILSGGDNSMESPSKSMLSGGDNSMESPSKSMLSGGDNSMESPSKSMLSGGDNSMESPSKSMLSGGDNSMESPSKSMLFGGESMVKSVSKPENLACTRGTPPSLRTQSKNFSQKASTCNKTLVSRKELQVHYESQSKFKSFLCEVCEQCFRTEADLRKHALTHTTLQSSDLASDNDDGDDDDKEQVDKSFEVDDKEQVDKSFDDVDDDKEQVDRSFDDVDKEQVDRSFDDDCNFISQEALDKNCSLEKDESLDEEDVDLDTSNDEDVDNTDKIYHESYFSKEHSLSSKSNNDHNKMKDNLSNCHSHIDDESKEGDTSQLTSSVLTTSSNNLLCLEANPAHLEPSSPLSLLTRKLPVMKESNLSGHRSHLNESRGLPASNLSQQHEETRQATWHKHQCKTCRKPFSSASALQIHTRTHTGDKPFLCTVCSKAFTTRGNLKVHMGTHMWNNSPSRRGRRMSIETSFLVSHLKDNRYLRPGFHPPSPLDTCQYPLPVITDSACKINEIPFVHSLNNVLPTYPHPHPHLHPHTPSHLVHTYLHNNDLAVTRDYRRSSESAGSIDQDERKPELRDRDLSVQVISLTESSLSASTSFTPSPSFLVRPVKPIITATEANASSPSNNKENSNVVTRDISDIRANSSHWGTVPCQKCGQVFLSQDSLDHHFISDHITKVESSALSKTEHHPQTIPTALLA